MLDKNFFKDLKKEIEKAKNSGGRIVFSISSTSKQKDEGYLTPSRKVNNSWILGCVLFDQKDVYDVLKHVDGIAEIILADTEKKIPISLDHEDQVKDIETVGYVETGNLSKICFDNCKISKVMEFKPNDITVNAVWAYISQKLNYCSGKKIAILGAGNIGSKLALKLVECGADIFIYRRNQLKGHQISLGLNAIKTLGTLSNIHYVDNPLKAAHSTDVIIGSSSGEPIIDINVVSCLKKNGILIDLGKNSFTKDAISLAIKNSIETYRVDITASLEGFIYEIDRAIEIKESSYGRRKIHEFYIVGGGFMGLAGDFIVDNVKNPNQVIGIADGFGDVKRKILDTEKNSIKKLEGLILNNNLSNEKI